MDIREQNNMIYDMDENDLIVSNNDTAEYNYFYNWQEDNYNNYIGYKLELKYFTILATRNNRFNSGLYNIIIVKPGSNAKNKKLDESSKMIKLSLEDVKSIVENLITVPHFSDDIKSVIQRFETNPFLLRAAELKTLKEESTELNKKLKPITDQLKMVNNKIDTFYKLCNHTKNSISTSEYQGQDPGSGKSEYLCKICYKYI